VDYAAVADLKVNTKRHLKTVPNFEALRQLLLWKLPPEVSPRET